MMTPVELLKQELKAAEVRRDQAGKEDSYARGVHFNAQNRFHEAVEEVKALRKAIEVLGG